jgi:copper resistance protein B
VTYRRAALAAALCLALPALPAGAAGPAPLEPVHIEPIRDDRVLTYLAADRLEWRGRGGDAAWLLDAEGWVGRDTAKLWVKLEGEAVTGEGVEEARAQVLYSRPLSRFWDVQAGLRRDQRPLAPRTHAVLGVQGLAPYRFEVDAAVFLSDGGDLTARAEAEYDLLLTQRLVAQPRLEANAAAREVDDLGLGAGLNDVQVGFRLRYEVIPEVAPYVGVTYARRTGATAARSAAAGAEVASTALVAGVRLWY